MHVFVLAAHMNFDILVHNECTYQVMQHHAYPKGILKGGQCVHPEDSTADWIILRLRPSRNLKILSVSKNSDIL